MKIVSKFVSNKYNKELLNLYYLQIYILFSIQ